jgi:hypothetical protein
MDQAALLSLIGSVYDKLVQDVADRVQQLSREAVDARIENWVDTYLDDRIGTWAEDNLDLEDAAREAIQNSDHLADFITETVKNNLTFTVSVD